MLGATLTELWTLLCSSHAKEQRKERQGPRPAATVLLVNSLSRTRQEVRLKNWKRASGMEGAIPPNHVERGHEVPLESGESFGCRSTTFAYGLCPAAV
jgi:hypothetical protein